MPHVKELFSLAGKTAVVTGGATGIGFQIAQGLAEAGANIVICSRKLDKCRTACERINQLGVQTLALSCDVTKEDDVITLVASISKRFGQIDILVNNAGLAWVASPEDLELVDWNRVLDLNLTGTFICSKYIGRKMIDQGGGKIINIASVSGLVGKDDRVINSIAYNASKGGVVNFTRDLAVKWAKFNICVNAIAPGFFITDLNEKLFQRKGGLILQQIPMKRVGGSDDLKGAVVYLASAASDFVTGHILSVDGGAVAW